MICNLAKKHSLRFWQKKKSNFGSKHRFSDKKNIYDFDGKMCVYARNTVNDFGGNSSFAF